MKRIFYIALSVTVVLGMSHIAVAQHRLRSPWDFAKVKLTDAPYACPAPVHLSADLTTSGFYGDNKGSVIDPVKMKAYAATSGPYKNLGNVVVAAADGYLATGSKAAAKCVLFHLDTAASDGVFTGKMSSSQAYFVQGWVIGAAAIAYLKIRDSGLATPEENARLAKWMETVAAQTQNYYDKRMAEPGHEDQNNHLYWAGVELAAIGVVADNHKLFDWAVAAYRNGIQQITPEGTLPLEMRRGQRALHYHLYAASPLVYMAEFGEDNGLDLYAENHYAIKRLVKRATDGLVDNSYFEKQTGIKQDEGNGATPSAEAIGWAKPYVKRFPDKTISELLARASSLSYMYLGGLPPS